MTMMCKGCGKAQVYKGSMCKGCHAMPRGDLMKVKKGEASSSESGSETTSEHGEQEVRMSLQQLHSVCEAATKLKGHVKKETLVPAWVQSLLTVAHENLEHIEGYFEGKHMKKAQPAVGAMTGVHAPASSKVQKPKMGTSMRAAVGQHGRTASHPSLSQSMAKSEDAVVPTFPHISGGNDRVLLHTFAPDAVVVEQITNRDTHQPHSYGLAAADPDAGIGLRRR